ncbi:toll/interleukin-1 receptor domain-containing protein [Streptomyces ovatisporus]|uniref:Toll/interleukin-1 receptor domain-containing protein n=1 Tax=Streptomyces ovatisporus TaxID=1128682 RepID=A0ABV9AC24_9ACTN
MTEVFINYRTGDGEKTAALLDQELSRRFGKKSVFRASKSIPPSELYPDNLLTALRRSSLLLVVVGPAWTSFRSQLHNPKDWVRREIELAFSHQLSVLPILDGRKTDRLSKADLPPELARLADLQSLPFDTHDTEAGVKRIGDVVAELVPWLNDSTDQAYEKSPAPDTVTNSIREVSGTAVQSREFTGDVGGTVVKGAQGPVHAGNGHIYQNSRHVSGDRQFSGNGMTYFEGDNHGNVQHRFNESDSGEDEGR